MSGAVALALVADSGGDAFGDKVIVAVVGATVGGAIGAISAWLLDRKKTKREQSARADEGRAAAVALRQSLANIRETLDAIGTEWVPEEMLVPEPAPPMLLLFLDEPAARALGEARSALSSVRLRIMLNEPTQEYPPDTSAGEHVISAATRSLEVAERELTRLTDSAG